MSERWMMIVNPNAGARRGARHWPAILKILREEGIDFEFRLTTGSGDAEAITAGAVSAGIRSFCVVGGDGTLNEVMNGLMRQKVVPAAETRLAMIPLGTGNDWCRMYDIPSDFRSAVRLLHRGETFLQDAGLITYSQHGKTIERYFINVAGLGYDALVARNTNRLKEKGRGGHLTYFWFVFASLFSYRFIRAVIAVDGNEFFSGEVFSMSAGICRYSGGGMSQVPGAVPDDGLIDITLIRKASKWMVVRYAHKLFDGSLVNLPIVHTARGGAITITSAGKLYLEADGESLGHTPVTISVIPRCVRVVTGRSSRPTP